MTTDDSSPQQNSVKITKRAVDALQPCADKDVWLWDTEIKGFGVRVTSGGTKAYVYKYREGKGRKARTRLLTIGRLPMTAEQARDKARDAAYRVNQGESPAEAEAVKKEDLYFKEVQALWEERHGKPYLKATSYKNYLYLWPFLIDRFGNMRLNQITKQDILQFHQGNKDTPYDANRKLALLSKVFNLCEEWELRPQRTNPCYGVRKYKEFKRERFLSLEELQRLNNVMDKAQRERTESLHFIALIRLLIFTGCRLNEIMQSKWEWYDLERGMLKLPDEASKTGQRAVVLNEAALQTLAALPRVEGNPYVIVSHRRKGVALNNPQDPWQRIRKEAGISDVRIHDLRHTHASMGAALGLSLPMIGALLGHTRAETTHRYAHLVNDPVKQASNLVGDAISKVFKPVSDDGKVVYMMGWRPKEAREKEKAQPA